MATNKAPDFKQLLDQYKMTAPEGGGFFDAIVGQKGLDGGMELIQKLGSPEDYSNLSKALKAGTVKMEDVSRDLLDGMTVRNALGRNFGSRLAGSMDVLRVGTQRLPFEFERMAGEFKEDPIRKTAQLGVGMLAGFYEVPKTLYQTVTGANPAYRPLQEGLAMGLQFSGMASGFFKGASGFVRGPQAAAAAGRTAGKASKIPFTAMAAVGDAIEVFSGEPEELAGAFIFEGAFSRAPRALSTFKRFYQGLEQEVKSVGPRLDAGMDALAGRSGQAIGELQDRAAERQESVGARDPVRQIGTEMGQIKQTLQGYGQVAQQAGQEGLVSQIGSAISAIDQSEPSVEALRGATASMLTIQEIAARLDLLERARNRTINIREWEGRNLGGSQPIQELALLRDNIQEEVTTYINSLPDNAIMRGAPAYQQLLNLQQQLRGAINDQQVLAIDQQLNQLMGQSEFSVEADPRQQRMPWTFDPAAEPAPAVETPVEKAPEEEIDESELGREDAGAEGQQLPPETVPETDPEVEYPTDPPVGEVEPQPDPRQVIEPEPPVQQPVGTGTDVLEPEQPTDGRPAPGGETGDGGGVGGPEVAGPPASPPTTTGVGPGGTTTTEGSTETGPDGGGPPVTGTTDGDVRTTGDTTSDPRSTDDDTGVVSDPKPPARKKRRRGRKSAKLTDGIKELYNYRRFRIPADAETIEVQQKLNPETNLKLVELHLEDINDELAGMPFDPDDIDGTLPESADFDLYIEDTLAAVMEVDPEVAAAETMPSDLINELTSIYSSTAGRILMSQNELGQYMLQSLSQVGSAGYDWAAALQEAREIYEDNRNDGDINDEDEPDITEDSDPEIIDLLEEVVGQKYEEQIEGVEAVYQPEVAPGTGDAAQPHPADMVTSTVMASAKTPELTYELSLTSQDGADTRLQDAIESGKISSLQVERAARGGQAHDRDRVHQPYWFEEMGKGGTIAEKLGYLIADGTGSGKTRSMLAMILDNINKGRKKHIWVGINQGGAWEDLVKVSEEKTGEAIDLGLSEYSKQNPEGEFFKGSQKGKYPKEGVLFTTYSGLGNSYKKWDLAYNLFVQEGHQVPNKYYPNLDINADGTQTLPNDPRARGELTSIDLKGWDKGTYPRIKEWMTAEFEGLILFDEAHRMKDFGWREDKQSGDLVNKGGLAARAGVSLPRTAKDARVVYATATPAAEAKNLQYAERLGLFGKGGVLDLPRATDLITLLQNLGKGAMEVLAYTLKQFGLYDKVDISLKDIEYQTETINVNDAQDKEYTIYSDLVRELFDDAINAIDDGQPLGMTQPAFDKDDMRNFKGIFHSFTQRLFGNLQVNMMMPDVIRQVEQDIADGYAPVIQVFNTGEATQSRELERLTNMGIKTAEERAYHADFSVIGDISNFIMTNHPVARYIRSQEDLEAMASLPRPEAMAALQLHQAATDYLTPLVNRMQAKIIGQLAISKADRTSPNEIISQVNQITYPANDQEMPTDIGQAVTQGFLSWVENISGEVSSTIVLSDGQTVDSRLQEYGVRDYDLLAAARYWTNLTKKEAPADPAEAGQEDYSNVWAVVAKLAADPVFDRIQTAYPLQIKQPLAGTIEEMPSLSQERLEKSYTLASEFFRLAIKDPNNLPSLMRLSQHFGSRIVEMSGRDAQAIYGTNDAGQEILEVTTGHNAQREDMLAEFMDNDPETSGGKEVLVFSKAGATGRSYHNATNRKNNRQRVHYMLQLPWAADEGLQGMGRTHRSNQHNAPILKIMDLNMPSRKRFLGMFKKRIEELGAIATGQSGGSSMIGDEYDVFGEIGQFVFKKLYRQMLEGSHQDFFLSSPQAVRELTLEQYLNRLLAAPVETQDRLFQAFHDMIKSETDRRERQGTLDIGKEDIVVRGPLIETGSTIFRDIMSLKQRARSIYQRFNARIKPNSRNLENLFPAMADSSLLGISRAEFVGLYHTTQPVMVWVQGTGANRVFTMFPANGSIPDAIRSTSEKMENDEILRRRKAFRIFSPDELITPVDIDKQLDEQIVPPEVEQNRQQALEIWQNSINNSPVVKRTFHLFTGALSQMLRQFGASSEGGGSDIVSGTINVKRLKLQDGSSLVGVQVPRDNIRQVQRTLIPEVKKLGGAVRAARQMVKGVVMGYGSGSQPKGQMMMLPNAEGEKFFVMLAQDFADFRIPIPSSPLENDWGETRRMDDTGLIEMWHQKPNDPFFVLPLNNLDRRTHKQLRQQIEAGDLGLIRLPDGTEGFPAIRVADADLDAVPDDKMDDEKYSFPDEDFVPDNRGLIGLWNLLRADSERIGSTKSPVELSEPAVHNTKDIISRAQSMKSGIYQPVIPDELPVNINTLMRRMLDANGYEGESPRVIHYSGPKQIGAGGLPTRSVGMDRSGEKQVPEIMIAVTTDTERSGVSAIQISDTYHALIGGSYIQLESKNKTEFRQVDRFKDGRDQIGSLDERSGSEAVKSDVASLLEDFDYQYAQGILLSYFAQRQQIADTQSKTPWDQDSQAVKSENRLAAGVGIDQKYVEMTGQLLEMLGVENKVFLLSEGLLKTKNLEPTLDRAHVYSNSVITAAASLRDKGIGGNISTYHSKEGNSTNENMQEFGARIIIRDEHLTPTGGLGDLEGMTTVPEEAQVLLHELGHFVECVGLKNADASVRQAVDRSYQSWKSNLLANIPNMSARELVMAVDPISVEGALPLESSAQDYLNQTGNRDYHLSKDEWFANQVYRWFTYAKEPLSVVDKFFKGIAEAIKKVFKYAVDYLKLGEEAAEAARLDMIVPDAEIQSLMDGMLAQRKAKLVPSTKADNGSSLQIGHNWPSGHTVGISQLEKEAEGEPTGKEKAFHTQVYNTIGSVAETVETDAFSTVIASRDLEGDSFVLRLNSAIDQFLESKIDKSKIQPPGYTNIWGSDNDFWMLLTPEQVEGIRQDGLEVVGFTRSPDAKRLDQSLAVLKNSQETVMVPAAGIILAQDYYGPVKVSVDVNQNGLELLMVPVKGDPVAVASMTFTQPAMIDHYQSSNNDADLKQLAEQQFGEGQMSSFLRNLGLSADVAKAAERSGKAVQIGSKVIDKAWNRSELGDFIGRIGFDTLTRMGYKDISNMLENLRADSEQESHFYANKFKTLMRDLNKPIAQKGAKILGVPVPEWIQTAVYSTPIATGAMFKQIGRLWRSKTPESSRTLAFGALEEIAYQQGGEFGPLGPGPKRLNEAYQLLEENIVNLIEKPETAQAIHPVAHEAASLFQNATREVENRIADLNDELKSVGVLQAFDDVNLRLEAQSVLDEESETSAIKDFLAPLMEPLGINLEGAKITRPNSRKYTVRFNCQPIRVRSGVDRYIVGVEDGQLKIFDESQIRHPVFLFEQDGAANNTVKSIWEPSVKNYFPHKFDWRDVGDVNDVRNAKFTQLVQGFATANSMSIDDARQVLLKMRGNIKSNKYSNLEVERKFNFPGYRKDFFTVASEWTLSSFKRLHEIEQLGQMGEVLNREMGKVLNPLEAQKVGPDADASFQKNMAIRRALFKFRSAFGVPLGDLPVDADELYQTGSAERVVDDQRVEVETKALIEQLPFWDERGKPVEFRQDEPRFHQLNNLDWSELIQREVVVPVKGKDGWYQSAEMDRRDKPSEKGNWLNNPFGADINLLKDYAKAVGIVNKHLGYDPVSGVDSQLHETFANMKGVINYLYLTMAWTANLTQTANVGGMAGFTNAVKGFAETLRSREGRSYARAIGATVEDFTQHLGGGNPLSDYLFEYGTPFSDIERNNRTIAALAGRNYAADALVKLGRSGVEAKEVEFERRKFEELKIPQQELVDVIDQAYTEEEVWQASKLHYLEAPKRLQPASKLIGKTAKMVSDATQFRTQPADLPRVFYSGPLGRLITQFTTFTTKQTDFAYKMLVGRNFNRGKLLRNLIKGGGVTNLFSFLSLAMGLGYVANILGNLLDKEKRDEVAQVNMRNAVAGLTKASVAGIFTELVQGNSVPGSISTLYGIRPLRVLEEVVRAPERLVAQAVPVPYATQPVAEYIRSLGQESQSPRPSAMSIIQQRTGQQRPQLQRPTMR